MKKIVLTGASSFIGRNLISKASGWDIIAVVRRGNKSIKPASNVSIVELNMDEYANLGKITGDADCFISLAWNGTRSADRINSELQSKNVLNSVSAVKSMLNVGCKKVILAGSQAEYGQHTEQIDEAVPCFPNTAYGKAKLAFCEAAMQLCEEYRVSCIEPRFFSLFGPDDYAGSMVIDMLRKMLDNQPCDLTEGTQMWDFMYIDDAVEALIMLCEKNCNKGVYNFAGGDCRPLRSFVEEMARITHTKSKLNFGAIPYSSEGKVSIYPDITKLKRELNWAPRVSFAEGIRAILKCME